MDLLATDVPLRENEILNEFEIPVGSWFDQMVDWIDLHFSDVDGNWFPLLDWIEWPFEFLLTNLVDNWLLGMSWTTFCLGIFFIGYVFRNAQVGFMSALGIAGCGLLGNEYWLETARTVGFVAVAVLLCLVVGIPVGVLCGRFDAVWSAVRPALDAMQVVHSFVYMMPFIFFFGIGEESATMVTMVYAVPPLVRLTNLGVRQVPDEVVEASRAFGASERRVLFDVQLPLAKPAIMTGINQTLLLSISMIGIAAIMGAGGLGRLLFQALSNLDVSQAASGGFAFFLVAVVLDRLTQPETSDGTTLFSRITNAWATRHTPELNLAVPLVAGQVDDVEVPEPIGQKERASIVATGVLASVVVVATLSNWGRNAGLVSSHARRNDEHLDGMSFTGIEASGGSWFGLAALGFALFIIYTCVARLSPAPSAKGRRPDDPLSMALGVAVIFAVGLVAADVLLGAFVPNALFAAGLTLIRPGKNSRWLGADGVAIAALGMTVLIAAYVFMSPSSAAVDYQHAPGIWVAMLAGIGVVCCAGTWLAQAPYSPYRPIRGGVAVGRLVAVAAGVLIVVIAAFSGWTFDARADSVVTPDVQAEIDRLSELGRSDRANAAAYAAQISTVMARAQNTETIVTDGLASTGAQLGRIAIVVALLAALASAPGAGVWRLGDHGRYAWSSIAAGLGAGTAAIGVAWIAAIARAADRNMISGAGALLAVIAGAVIVAANLGLVREFFRSVVFDYPAPAQAAGDPAVHEQRVSQPAGRSQL